MAVPDAVLSKMRDAGAVIRKDPDALLTNVSGVTFRDPAWNAYEAWANTVDASIMVGAGFGPSPQVIEARRHAPPPLTGPILIEANSIRSHFAALHPDDVDSGERVEVAGPLNVALSFQEVHPPKLAMSPMLSTIENPSQADYPSISQLPAGFYICDVAHFWSNAVVQIAVFKQQ